MRGTQGITTERYAVSLNIVPSLSGNILWRGVIVFNRLVTGVPRFSAGWFCPSDCAPGSPINPLD